MRILLLSRYGRLGSSSRLRSYQYIDFLNNRGIDVTIAPLFDDDYVRRFYEGGGKSAFSIITSYCRRLLRLTHQKRFDLIWLEGELFPYFPALSETLLIRTKTPYIVDYDDAIFHRYDLHRNPLVRAALSRKIDKIMQNANIVLAGNNYIAERAENVGARNVVYFPTVVDLERYKVSNEENEQHFTIGWIGSPVTAKYLLLVSNALATISRDTKIKLKFIGTGNYSLPGLPYESHLWSEESEASQIATFDIGIMPLPDEPWERGKCGYKLIQYMACGKPVLASPVGANTDIVDDNVNGFLAKSEQDWIRALHAFTNNPELRIRMGKAGRKKVENDFCLQKAAPRLETIINKLC